MKGSKYECCTTYFFPTWAELCISGNEPHPYYPDYTMRTCLNDGEHPDWQTGDYLTDNHYTCCSTHFGHDSDLLDRCSGTATFEEVTTTEATTSKTIQATTAATTTTTTTSNNPTDKPTRKPTRKPTKNPTSPPTRTKPTDTPTKKPTSVEEGNSGGTADAVEEILLDRKTAID